MAQVKISVYQSTNAKMTNYGRYYGRVKHGNPISVETLCKNVALDSGIAEEQVAVVFDAILKQMKEQLCAGHPIKVDHLGTVKIGIHSNGVSAEDVKKKHPDFDPEKDDIRRYLTAKLVKKAHLLFNPCTEIKTALREIKYVTDKSEWSKE